MSDAVVAGMALVLMGWGLRAWRQSPRAVYRRNRRILRRSLVGPRR